MPRLNIPGSRHVAPAAVAGWQWLPISAASYKSRIQHALNIITNRVQAYGPCNAAFRALSGGRTFAQVWADPTVWISYDPGAAAGRFGATLGHEVTLSQYACRMGQWRRMSTVRTESPTMPRLLSRDA
jgi:hypothetical protein